MIQRKLFRKLTKQAAPLAIGLAFFLLSPKLRADENSRPIWLGFSGLGLVHHNNQNDINQALRTAGYSSIGSNQPIVGMGFDFGVGRWRLTWDTGLWGARSFKRHSDATSYSVRQANISIDTGVDLIQYRGFSVFPMVGLAGGDLRIDIDSQRAPLFREQIWAMGGGSHELRQNTWSTRLLLGVEQRIPVWNRPHDRLLLLFGLRIGYQNQLSHSEWILFDDPALVELHGGPSVNVSGPFVRFAVGLAGEPLGN